VAEGIPAFGNALPFAGRRRNDGLGRLMSTAGTSSPPREESTTSRGALRSSPETGNHHPRGPAAAGGGRDGPLLGAARPVQSSAVFQRPSPQAVVGSGRRPQAACRSGDGFRGLAERRACIVARSVPEGLPRFAALVILLREGKVACPKKHAKARSPSTSTRESDGTVRSAKTGGSGVCPCVG